MSLPKQEVDRLIAQLNDTPDWNVLIVAFSSVEAMTAYVESHIDPDKSAYYKDKGGNAIERKCVNIESDIFDIDGVDISLAPAPYLADQEGILIRNPCFIVPNITVAEIEDLAKQEATT